MGDFKPLNETLDFIAACDLLPLSREVLCHSHLLTPVLNQCFGPVFVKISQHQEQESSLYSESSIFTQAQQQKILTASLTIQRRALPYALLWSLKNTDKPLGTLLIDSGYSATLQNQRFFRSVDAAGECCFGRCHDIFIQSPFKNGLNKNGSRKTANKRADADETPMPALTLLCHVEERLVPDQQLQALIISPNSTSSPTSLPHTPMPSQQG